MRAFIALELSSTCIEDITSLVRSLVGVVEGRFVTPDAYHLTLAFLGEIGEVKTRDAMAALEEVSAGREPVALTFEGLGSFGRPRDATLWLGVCATPQLIDLAAGLRNALETRNLSFDKKPFRPHVTLARRARLEGGVLPNLAFPAPDVAQRITLFKSILSPPPATYKLLYACDLNG